MERARPLSFTFREEYATEIAAFIIEKVGVNGEINHTKLLKLLYIVERNALFLWKRPIIGGTYVSMNQGPLSSDIYDLIKKTYPSVSGFWERYIVKSSKYDVRLIDSPGTGHFTKALRKIIDTALNDHGKKTWDELSRYCHENFKEWQDPSGSSRQIPYEAIFEAEGRGEEIEESKQEADEQNQIERIFGY
jgi:uncharacterized phage-associated protein